MNLYLISQNVNVGYDTYDSAVVAARTEVDAKAIHPAEFVDAVPKGRGPNSVWANQGSIKAKLIGIAIDGTKRGVIVASFNAG